MERKCYYYSIGTIFSKNDKQVLKDCWNCNPNCCKSDLCNGLWCDNYGINFSKEDTEAMIKYATEKGVINSYGYMKEIIIDLDDEEWNDIDNSILKNYGYTALEYAKANGFISFDYYDIIEDSTPYWEQPDLSYLKKSDGSIEKNVLEVKTEEELDPDIIEWINDSFYSTLEKHQEMEL